MEGAAHPREPRRVALLLEQIAAPDDRTRPSANDRLERALGGYLARLLVGALTPTRTTRLPRG